MGRPSRVPVVGLAGVALTVLALVSAPAAPGAASPSARTAAAVAVERIGGADRFAVAAGVAEEGYAPGPPVVYVASGRVFADALAAAPVAAFLGGPILLTERDRIPTATVGALDRLRPDRIVVVGGRMSVSSAVLAELRNHAREATRIGGVDRYEVAANVSRGVFPPNERRPQYIASGRLFTDALGAGPAAGFVNAPVFLVDPRAAERDGVEGATQPEGGTVLVGGPASVPTWLDTAFPDWSPVTRIQGADRFEVSANLSAATFDPGVGVAFVASGRVFADALAGGPLAASLGAPVLLVEPDRVPEVVMAELRRLAPDRVVVLGGPATVSEKVVDQLAAL